MKIKHSIQKNFKINYSGRSSDYISPNFIFGCELGCKQSYCYVSRKNLKYVYIFKNYIEILDSIQKHYLSLPFKIPNQTGSVYSYDIGCDSDIAAYAGILNLQDILKFFIDNKILSTFATKCVNNNLLKYKVNNSYNRIRFSLMPQNMSDKLEPKTSKIIDRISAIDNFINAGWEVHVNFSPIVVYRDWLDDYKKLFELIDKQVKSKILLKSENIFLTHNEKLHERNINNGFEYEHFLWVPKLQETKQSSYGSENIRYNHNYKSIWVSEFLNLQKQIIPYVENRYIF